ncbi:MAG TPA: fibronectin type III domain-containing protein, partial [Gemmataceae bacterium]|nr:fibronectin type III domain-containing protein [Gemmataceae bacterium]
MSPWLRRLLSIFPTKTKKSPRRQRVQLQLEGLENRVTPANHAPLAPVITEPFADGVSLNGSDVHMVIAPFQDPDVGDVQTAADWEIWTTGAGAQVVWQADGINDPQGLTRIFYAYGTFVNGLAGKQELAFDTDYQLRVRVADSSGDLATQWSPWSLRTFHTDPALQPTPGVGTWAVDQPGFKVEQVAGGLQLPVNVAFVPNPGPLPTDPYFYVTELYGTIAMVERNGTVLNYATNLLNFNPTGQFPGSGEQGVAGVCVDPASGDLFATMVYDGGDGNHYPKIVRLHSNDGGHTAASLTNILMMPGETMGQSHFISNASIGPDGKLWVHIGDGFVDGLGQDLTSFRGKIIRLNFDGTACTDNPFYNAADGITARDYVYTYGYRNPFGGAWRTSDNAHYVVENGPSVDRISKVVAGRNYLFDGTDASMHNFAIYNWGPPAHAPVNDAFIQTSVFGGSRYPASKQDHLFVAESGSTFASGPVTNGKQITEFVIDGSGNLVSGPTRLIHYNGTGNSTVVALAAGPDGLYFSDLYAENGGNPVAFGAHIFRVKWIGTAAPVAPVSLNASAVSNSRINLSWANSSDNEDGFRIEESTNGVNFTEIGSAAANVTTFDVVNLAANTTYYFRVRPFSNDLGNGNYSPTAFATTTISSSIPTAPTLLNAQAVTNSEIDLGWQNNANNENGFYVEQSLNASTGFLRVATLPAGTTSYSVMGLQVGTPYFFRVQAFNSAGASNYTNVANAATLARVPFTPAGLIATGGASQVALTWQAATDAVTYNVYRSTTPGGEGSTPIASSISATAYTDTTANNGVTYFYKVAAVNSIGASPQSSEVSATPGQPPFAAHINFQPSNVPIPSGYIVDSGLTYAARNGLTYGWNVDDSDNTRDRNDPASPDQRYDTLIHMDVTQFWEIAVPNGSYILHIVSGDPSYTDSVHKINVEGALAINFTPTVGNFWKEATVTVTVNDGRLTVTPASGAINDKLNYIDITANAPAIPPPAPTGLTATAGINQVALAWSASAGATSYNVYRGITPNGEAATPVASGITGTTFTNSGLSNGVTFFFKVTAVGASGESQPSAEVFATPQPPAIAAPPTNPIATPGNTQIVLSWTASTGATTYNVYRSLTANAETGPAIATGLSATSFTNTGLTNGVTYYYKVTAVNAGGESAMSTEAFATPQLPAIPAAPTTLTPTASPNQVALTWIASTGAATYNVYRSLTPGTETGPAIASGLVATSYTNTGLTNGVTYYYTVTAVNAGGESPMSTEAFATPQPLPAPNPPTGLGAIGGANQVALSWTGSTGATSYKVYRGTTSNGESATAIATVNTGTTYTDLALTNGTTYYYKVSAVGSGGESTLSNEAFATPQAPAFVAHVNFQPANAAIPAGYVVDAGAVYAARNGFTYGWNVNNSGSARDRNDPASADQRYDTLVQFDNTQFWEIAVPNGTYTVHVVAGDPSYIDSVHKINVEGVPAINFTPSFANLWQEATVTVTVNDGRLTVAPATGAVNDKIDYIDITSGTLFPPPAAPAGLTATPGAGLVTLSWTASTGATSYNVYRGTTAGGEGATPIATGITTTGYSDTGLTGGTTYYYKVTAVGSGGQSGLSTEAFATPTTAPGFAAKINFQPANAPIPAGYTVDAGLVYAARNGLTYGWNTDDSGSTRDRNDAISPDQRYDTLIHFANNQFWEIAV